MRTMHSARAHFAFDPSLTTADPSVPAMSAAAAASMVDEDDRGSDDGRDPRIHDLMDKLDDLGFPVAVSDGIAAALDEDGAASLAAGGALAKVLQPLLSDLEAFAHGTLRTPRTDLAQELVEVLRRESFPHSSLLSQGVAFLSTLDGRILALDFLLSEVQAAKMLALTRHKQKLQQQQQASGAQGLLSSAGAGSQPAGSPQPAGGKAVAAKKRGGDGADADSHKRARGSQESAAAASASAMEDVPAADSASSDSEECSYEMRLLAHTLQVVLNQAAVKAAAGGAEVALNGATALRLLRTRLQAWLAESPVHQQAAALPPLFRRSDFSSQQLAVLADIHRTFQSDYTLRVHMLRKRLEVTLQSFMWGGKGKLHEDDLARLAATKLASFPTGSQVDEYELWASTPTVLHISRMTSREYAQRSSIKRVIIGKVPDRGGRVDTNTRLGNDYEMPAFAKRSTSTGSDGSHHRGGGGGGGRSGGGGGRGRGGR